MDEDKPITVNPNVGVGMLLMAVRQVALIIGGGVSIAGMVRGHDLRGAVDYIQTDGFATAVAACSTVGVFFYGQFRDLKHKAEAVIMADALPDTIARVGAKRGWLGRLVDRVRAL